MGTIKLLSPEECTPEIIARIMELGMASETWQESDKEYYQVQFMNPANINIVYLDDDGQIMGQILGKPYDEAIVEYQDEDPGMRPSSVPTFYVDNIMVDEGMRSGSLGMRLLNALLWEGNRQGFFRFACHCRASTGFNEIIKKKFAGGINEKDLRWIDKYVDGNNEPYEYIEGDVTMQ